MIEIPRKPTAAEVLVLVSRARQVDVEAGRLDPSRLFDLRVFKTVTAELAYYRRLAYAGTPSAHVATSMPQLVRGLAKLHPRWRMSGDPMVDRDRHHSAVRRRLRVMRACGLLTWAPGVNLDGEEVRTELVLHEIPADISPQELKAARAQITRWKRTYGPSLDTGSSTEIRGLAKAAANPTPTERRTLARNRVQQARAARVRGERSLSKTAPPFGTAVAFSHQQNSRDADGFAADRPALELRSPTHRDPSSCGYETGARAGVREFFSTSQGAVEGTQNSRTEGEVDRPRGDLGHAGAAPGASGALSGAELSAEAQRRVAAVLADPVAMERLAAKQRSVDELHAAIARQATRRTLELAASPAERAWPPVRVREAWTLSRYGADQIGAGAATAVRLSHERHAQLLRAVKRYARYLAPAIDAHAAGAQVPPELADRMRGMPAAPWAAFLHLAAAGTHQHPAGTIQALDVLSRQLRALATATDPDRRAAMSARAHARHAPPKPHEFHRIPGHQWPAWLRLNDNGQPQLREDPHHGQFLAIDHDHPHLPPAGDPHRRLIERDAWLVLGHWPPTELDGRKLRHQRATGTTEPAQRPAPFDPEQAEILELAHLEPDLSPGQAARLAPELRGDMLRHARHQHLAQHHAERDALQQQLAQNPSQPNREIPPGWHRAAEEAPE